MSPARERTQVADVPPTPALVQRVRSVLHDGGLVILPTETVYGIAARADSMDALERLGASKDRP
jgi:L-threonylcarbamoyladenylate synthase